MNAWAGGPDFPQQIAIVSQPPGEPLWIKIAAGILIVVVARMVVWYLQNKVNR